MEDNPEGIQNQSSLGITELSDMKLSINSRRKFNGFMLLAQALPQYLGCGLSFS